MARDYKNRKSTPRRETSTTPGWVWLVAGLAIGLGVAVGVHVHHTRNATMQQVVADSIAPDPSPPETTRPLRFEFYEALPNGLRELLSDNEVDERSSEKQPVTARAGTQYFIQAGAFRRAGEADRLRAELALLGLEAKVQKSKNWHRVRLGPYRNMSALAQDKRRLPSADKVLVYELKI